MDVFGSSQTSTKNKFVINIEQDINSFSKKLDKFEHLLEESHNSVKLHEEQTAILQSLLIDYMKKTEVTLQHIKENTDKLKTNSCRTTRVEQLISGV